ncbi:MAG: hypothetical protein E7550_03805 [Ruminococcaceae bacterium]|nr:hypothetical protein [Oscillospiraceae bacterium]
MKKVVPLKALLCAFFCFLLLIPAISGCKEKNDINDNPLIPSESQKEEDKPTLYAAKASVIATNSSVSDLSSKIGTSDLVSSLAIIDTCVDAMKTYSFYEVVLKQPEIAHLNLLTEELREMTEIKRRNDESLFIDIEVYSGDAKTAVILANAIAAISPEYISNILPGFHIVVADKAISASLAD